MDNKMKLFSLILNFEEDIKKSWMTMKFNDNILEESFLDYDNNTKAKLKLSVFIFIPFVYLVEIIYGIFIIKPYIVYGTIHSTCLVLHLMLFILFRKIKHKIYIKIILYSICVIFISNLIYLVLSYIQMGLEEFRFLRIIYMLILIKNLIYILIMDNNIFVCLVFFFINSSFFIYCAKIISTSIVDEITVEIILSTIGFFIKNFYDETLRIVFIQKLKFEKLYDYNNTLINCMSGYHLSYYNNQIVYTNDNLKNLVNYKMYSINRKGN